MSTCIRKTWINIVVSCIFMFIVNAAIFAGTLRRKHEPEAFLYYNPRSEAGFDLNQEDMTKFHIWPTGIIPYYIDDFSFDKVLRDRIRMFLDGVNKLTALRFTEIPKPPEDDETRWVLFLNRKGLLGCADHPFKHFTNEGFQKVVLGYDCINSDENLADVVLSLVGVPPQHNAPDRDKYVDIMKENILPDKLHLFNKLKDTEWLFHNLKYDFESAGHYAPFKHTSTGKVTVQRKTRDYYFHIINPPALKEKGFSSQDILKIAMLYNYILRNRETPVPECGKLFAPGSKPVLLQQNKDLEIKPRKKPSRYLGESEEGKVSDKEENVNEEMNSDNNYDKEMSDDNERKDTEEINNESEIEENESKNNDSENVENNQNYHEDYENEENEKEFNLSDKIKDDNKNKYNNEKDNNEEKDYSININEGNEKKLNANNKLQDGDEDDEEKENKENQEKLNENESNDYYKELNHSFNDSNKKESNHEEYTVNVKKRDEISDNKCKPSNKNNVVTENIMTYDGIVNTTRNYDRKPLKYKIVNPEKQKLLGQSDYETGDEGKDKYIHEKTF